MVVVCIMWARSSVWQSAWLLTKRPRVQFPSGPLLILYFNILTFLAGGKNLKIDILEHMLVPKHEIMSDSEIEDELSDADFVKENLPKIKIDDPVVKHIDAKVGDVLRITRDSPTAGEFITYRIVDG